MKYKAIVIVAPLVSLAIGSARSLEQVRQENLDLKKELGEKHQIIGR